MGMMDNLQAMLAAGQDNALLRFTLASRLLKDGEAAASIEHFAAAIVQDPDYSAAWKLYGKALHQLGRFAEACEVYRAGIEAAERKGDVQAAKEMQVFLRRAEKALSDAGSRG